MPALIQFSFRMQMQLYDHRTETTSAMRLMRGAALMLLLCFVLAGCQSNKRPQADIPLPGFGDERPARPTGVYAVIRRVDVPLDESTDEAWSIIDEQVVPPMTRGVWRGNGLRIGLLAHDALDRYSNAMPQAVAFSRSVINKSAYPVPIIETPRLRSDLRFPVDLTLPPRRRHIEMINGGDKSTLRLLVKIETQDDGQHTLVLTPQHYIPSPLTLIPRDPFEKEMDGRVYDELTLRISPGRDQIAVVGLHWPWPMGEVIEDDKPEGASATDRVSLHTSTHVPDAEQRDPAAPPAHLRLLEEALDADAGPLDRPRAPEQTPTNPRYQRIAPPLTTTLGSTLLTSTRIRQPVRTVLLITIEEPPKEATSAAGE